MTKKIIALVLTLTMGLSLTACSKSNNTNEQSTNKETVADNTENTTTTEEESTTTTPENITVTTKNGNDEEIQIEVPYDPQRIAVLDLASLDILDNLGLGDRIVGMSKGTSIDYLQKYNTDETIANLGTIKEADLEAVMACEPDVIFIGGRLSSSYDALSEIAPVITISSDYEVGLIESVKANSSMIASLFGLENEFNDIFTTFEERVAALAAVSKGHTALVGMVTSSNFNTLGNDSRCSIIGNEIGFENLAVDVDSTHGNESSFELVAKLNPEYIFVLDRDAAIGTDGAKLAKEVMDNELVQKTTAYENSQIIYLTPAVWYTAEGGLTATDIMLQDLEASLLR
ncbi:siderophore ABC transporter substrate-binding protein [Anaerosporobacter faecicola]|uniref:siderophore ABC transporter substrate-binding protein n=1 Tax=Anaerosporobacter faecicola TaxID=2718714 RepID=UPI0014393412|nr:ABC transporter substrate-binding protein [Anaerosporobacter faecicola]